MIIVVIIESYAFMFVATVMCSIMFVVMCSIMMLHAILGVNLFASTAGSGHNLTKLYDPPKVASPRRRVMVGQCAVSTVFRIAGGDPWVDGMDVLNAESGSVRQLGVTSIELCYRHGIFYVLQRCQSICQAVSAVILVEGL